MPIGDVKILNAGIQFNTQCLGSKNPEPILGNSGCPKNEIVLNYQTTLEVGGSMMKYENYKLNLTSLNSKYLSVFLIFGQTLSSDDVNANFYVSL